MAGLVSVLLLAVAAMGCATQPRLDSQGQALIRAHDEWIAAINRGDTPRGLAGMTEDAAILAGQGPITQGTEEVRQHVARLMSVPGLHVEFALTKSSVSPDGRVGFVVGDSKITAPGPDGKLHTTSQRLLTVWRRDGNRPWRCYLDVVMQAATS